MKTTKKCPKCGSDQVVMLLGQSFGTKIYPRESYANTSSVERYACTDCGYLETFLADRDEIEELKKSLK
jgi:ribosomal protein S27AE